MLNSEIPVIAITFNEFLSERVVISLIPSYPASALVGT